MAVFSELSNTCFFLFLSSLDCYSLRKFFFEISQFFEVLLFLESFYKLNEVLNVKMEITRAAIWNVTFWVADDAYAFVVWGNKSAYGAH